jgi:hypothetical protein
MNIEYKIKKLLSKSTSLSLFTIIFLLALLIPLIDNISPMQHVDGIPLLDRIMQFKQGSMSLDYYLFLKHGNSMHSIVYAIGFLDNLLFHNMPVIQTVLTFIGIFLSSYILFKVLYNDNIGIIKDIILSICVVFGGCLSKELFLPFQIGLTFTRPIFMLILLALIYCFMKEKKGIIYTLVVISACIAAVLHGIGIMFAGAFVYLHLMHRQGVKRTIVSFFPALFAVILQLVYNAGFGEVSSDGGSYLIRHFYHFIKSLATYYATPIGFIKAPRRLLVLIGAVIFVIVSVKLIYSLIVGLGINKKLSFLPKKYRVLSLNYSVSDSFMTALLGMSFLSSVSSALYVAARIDLIASIAADPTAYTLQCSRYIAYAVIPYIYIVWRLLNTKFSSIKIIAAKSAVLISVIVLFVNQNMLMEKEIKYLNSCLDLSAVGLLSGLSPNTSLTNVIWPGYEIDWYWVEEVPNLLNYFKTNNDYLWDNMPRIGSTVPNSGQNQTLSNVVTQGYEVPEYQVFTATTTSYPKTRYAAVLDINNTVVGFVHVERKGGFYHRKNKIYYDNNTYLKGFILSSAKESSYFTLMVK